MNSDENWKQKLSAAAVACRTAALEDAYPWLAQRSVARYTTPDECYEALSAISYSPASFEPLKRYAEEVGADTRMLGRWLLIQAALHATPKIASFPVSDTVKSLWADEVLFWSQPSPDQWFSVDSLRFVDMARIATLRRFPAGQFHWEISGLPRSYLLDTESGKRIALLACILHQTGGFSPMFETHVNARRKNRLTLSEFEAKRSYLLIAKSLEQQPNVKGLYAESWLYCESTSRVSPHLAWLRDFFRENGAFIASTRPAPVNSGFLVGSRERRELYNKGLYAPRITYVIWPRGAILEWSRRYEASLSEESTARHSEQRLEPAAQQYRSAAS